MGERREEVGRGESIKRRWERVRSWVGRSKSSSVAVTMTVMTMVAAVTITMKTQW